MSGTTGILIDRAVKDIAKSSSRLAFETAAGGAWPILDRYLTIDGRRAYRLGNVCGTCGFLFERMRALTVLSMWGN